MQIPTSTHSHLDIPCGTTPLCQIYAKSSFVLPHFGVIYEEKKIRKNTPSSSSLIRQSLLLLLDN
jgi:hypothetical protein